MSEENTGKTVYFTYNPANPPELTTEQAERLNAMRDEDINLSDLPDQSGKPGWRPGLYGADKPGPLRTALRAQLLPIDKEVLKFFSDRGDSPADEVNAVLREYVETHRKSA